MIQSKLIMAITSADDEQTDRISNRLGVEADHDDDAGTTIYGQCVSASSADRCRGITLIPVRLTFGT